jgi:hypothetical protein
MSALICSAPDDGPAAAARPNKSLPLTTLQAPSTYKEQTAGQAPAPLMKALLLMEATPTGPAAPPPLSEGPRTLVPPAVPAALAALAEVPGHMPASSEVPRTNATRALAAPAPGGAAWAATALRRALQAAGPQPCVAATCPGVRFLAALAATVRAASMQAAAAERWWEPDCALDAAHLLAQPLPRLEAVVPAACRELCAALGIGAPVYGKSPRPGRQHFALALGLLLAARGAPVSGAGCPFNTTGEWGAACRRLSGWRTKQEDLISFYACYAPEALAKGGRRLFKYELVAGVVAAACVRRGAAAWATRASTLEGPATEM